MNVHLVEIPVKTLRKISLVDVPIKDFLSGEQTGSVRLVCKRGIILVPVNDCELLTGMKPSTLRNKLTNGEFTRYDFRGKPKLPTAGSSATFLDLNEFM